MLFLEHFSDKYVYVNVMTNLPRFRGLGCPILGHTYNIYIYIHSINSSLYYYQICHTKAPRTSRMGWLANFQKPHFQWWKIWLQHVSTVKPVHPSIPIRSSNRNRRHVRPGEPAELSWSFFGNKPASSPKEAPPTGRNDCLMPTCILFNICL